MIMYVEQKVCIYIISIFSEPFFPEWVLPCPFRPLCSEKLHMDQGSGHNPIDRGGPKESKNVYFLFFLLFQGFP